MKKSEIKSKLTIRNLHSRYLINNLLVGIEGALKLGEVKVNEDVLNQLESFKKDLLNIDCPISSEPKKVKLEDQQKASSIGSRAYILIATYLDE
ncbi:hypothetical protein ACSTS3_21250 [Aquimarina muelleri]|uniref:hypothetical protein n=1 Tax=Aquimarina muelleri TaxID=279356 RepID=UPI003F6890BC